MFHKLLELKMILFAPLWQHQSHWREQRVFKERFESKNGYVRGWEGLLTPLIFLHYDVPK